MVIIITTMNSALLGDVLCNLVGTLFPFHVFLSGRLGHRAVLFAFAMFGIFKEDRS